MNDTINGYVAGRSVHLKKDAFITNEVKVMVALELLSQRVKSSEVGKTPASKEVLSAYSRLLSQVECLEGYGYGPGTFTPEGKTVVRSRKELGIERGILRYK